MEILRADDNMFEEFGQVYITTAYSGIIKARHYHKLQSDNFTYVKGKAIFDKEIGYHWNKGGEL